MKGLFRFYCQLLVAFAIVALCSAQGGTETKYPICYVCSDGGVSTITLPDVLVPVPESTGYSELSCETLRAGGEESRSIPEDLCALLDREDFRLLCGCENAASVAAPAMGPLAPSAASNAEPLAPSNAAEPAPAPATSGATNVQAGFLTLWLLISWTLE